MNTLKMASMLKTMNTLKTMDMPKTMSMLKKILPSKARVFVFLLCIGVACLFGTHSAYASQTLQKGLQGTCIWEYQQEEDGNVLYIYPDLGSTVGDLGTWDDRPCWAKGYHIVYARDTKHVVVQSRVTASICRRMFSDFVTLKSVDFVGLDVSGVRDLSYMFSSCASLTSLDLSGWDTSVVGKMSHLFSGASALTTLDLGGWDTGTVDYGPSGMTSMFSGLRSLKVLRLGPKFTFRYECGLPYAGANVGTHWMRIGEGTPDNPKGQVFASAGDLIKYQNERHSNEQDNDSETYVRITPACLLMYDKGSGDATGVVASQRLTYNCAINLNKNLYRRPGYTFVGWKNEHGIYFADRAYYVHNILEHNVRHIFTAQWAENPSYEKIGEDVESLCLTVKHGKSVQLPHVYPTFPGLTFLGWRCGDGDGVTYLPGDTLESVTEDLTLYTVWRSIEDAVLTYVVEDDQAGTVSIAQERFSASTGIPQGATAIPREGYVFHRWTCRRGGFTWVYEEPTLTKEQIDLLAKKDDVYISTIFTAHFLPRIHTVSFRYAPRFAVE